MREDSRITKSILSHIAKHLSTRTQCRNIEYTVHMENCESGPIIWMIPRINVFPNTHKRREIDEESVITHVLKYHVQIRPDSEVVPGTYVYKLSSTGKRRRWEKISE